MVPDHYFFFSYAHADVPSVGMQSDASPLLERFYNDLSLALRQQIGLEVGREVGWRDEKKIQTGHDWSVSLKLALCEAKSIVCIYSEAYFHSPWCGKEMQVFLTRHGLLSTNDARRAIVPVIWRKPNQIPKVLEPFLEADAEMPQSYRELGLLAIMQDEDPRRHADYVRFVETFARRVRSAADVCLPPVAPRDLNFITLLGAFAVEAVNMIGGSADVQHSFQAYEGPSVARFVYVAATRPEMSTLGIRETLDPYGPERYQWIPYVVDGDREHVGMLAQKAASSKGLLHERMDIGPSLDRELRRAKENNTPVVLVIDAWSLRIEDLMRYMKEYDERLLPNCAALVVWDQHEETLVHREELEEILSETFNGNITSRGERFFRPQVTSKAHLTQELSDTLQHLKFTIINRGRPRRAVQGANPVPTL